MPNLDCALFLCRKKPTHVHADTFAEGKTSVSVCGRMDIEER